MPAGRLRTYGGTVKAGAGAATGGHGWTAYQRESDNEWVVLDFSYFPETISTSLRKSMAEDLRYVEDYFYMTLTEFIETKGSNRVRDPDGYDRMGRTKNSLLVGVLVNSLI